jgi:glyoxylase-like metal-dependent hydrolase (beta-lactamase superfamily II)
VSATGTSAVHDPGEIVARAGAMIEVRLLRLRWSNAYLLVGERVVLVDAGSPGDERTILAAVAALGRGRDALAAIVLTHGHADHAGAAAAVRAATGAPVLLGAGDVAMAAAGRNVALVPTGLEARLVRPFVPQAFPPLAPDEVLEGPRDLAGFGVPATVRPLGGHTRGSAIVELGGGDVLVGDLVRGGRLGGRWRGTQPMTHYYEEEPAAVTAVVDLVLGAGARRLLVGHGGPLAAAAVAAWRGGRPA